MIPIQFKNIQNMCQIFYFLLNHDNLRNPIMWDYMLAGFLIMFSKNQLNSCDERKNASNYNYKKESPNLVNLT